MYQYSAFNLNVQSDFQLPELCAGGSPPDVTIRRGVLGAAPAEAGPITCVRAAEGEALLAWGKVGLVLIRGGAEIVIDPAPGVHIDALRLLLSGAALGVLMHQRGLTVLHASAVAVNGQVAAFVGDKGAGKSSMAAALSALGHTLITDDLLAVRLDDTGCPTALFAYPQLKIWPDTAEMLGMDTARLARIRPDVEKLAHRPAAPAEQAAYPLRRIYVLGVGDSLSLQPLPAQSTFFILLRNLYISRFGGQFHQPGLQPSPFEQAAALARALPVSGLIRPVDLTALPAAARLIEAEFTASQPN